MKSTASLLFLIGSLLSTGEGGDYFAIRVVDQQTARGVPLVELRTVNNIPYYTDSNGLVAFHEPGLMGRRVFFHVKSHGYEFPKDGFGYRGKRLNVVAGGEATLKIKRINIAQRLYRVTGAGIYRDTVLLGSKPPTHKPLLNASVFGSDSVVNVVYRGRIYWFWGDTNRPSYPLGNFHVPGATSKLPKDGGLDPEQAINLDYFADQDGFAKETCKMSGQGPTWIDALTVVTDDQNRERMYAKYVKVKPPLTVYERGLVEFDPSRNEFEKRQVFPMTANVVPAGHSLHYEVDGIEYVYFAKPFPWVRVRATAAAIQNLDEYEAYTCVTSGSSLDNLALDRDATGKLEFAWRQGAPAWTPKLERRLVEEKRLGDQERVFLLTDVETGENVTVHSTSVAWNAYRQRWIMIALESFGTSPLGEIWFSEAANPIGPWRRARKVVTHDQYSFYNPKQHAMLAKDGGRIVFFEGTYTNMFSGNPDQTPRYNYNQVMYKLDLSEARLAPELFRVGRQ